MIEFILNDRNISTDLPPGTTVLDFVRYHQNLKGTKIGCREGDCGACTVLTGELIEGNVRYRSMTSCLMPLANAAGKHIVTIEGINPDDGSLTPVQKALFDESGTQCGFCTVGFVMSLTGFCLESISSQHVNKGSPELALSSIDGNICRCTGYKSIERAALRLCGAAAKAGPEVPGPQSSPPNEGEAAEGRGSSLRRAVDNLIVPQYFSEIADRLRSLETSYAQPTKRGTQNILVSGGTDVYVQNPDQMAETAAQTLFYDEHLRGIRDLGDQIEIGASTTVTDLLESPIMQAIFPNLYKHLKLVSSTPIRNMATLAGNFANASPIGDMTIWFLALDAEIDVGPGTPSSASPHGGEDSRSIKLRDLYQGYKKLAKGSTEIITAIRFQKPSGDFRFNFEKVSKRTYLDIATVNTAISIRVNSPHLSKGSGRAGEALTNVRATDATIAEAHLSAGGVAPVPLYLKQTSAFLAGRPVTAETIAEANEIMRSEISPISDVRGTADYKRLLLRQLFKAHFIELFGPDAI